MDLSSRKASVWTAFRARAISRIGRDVLLTLATFRGAGGRIYPSHATLAERVGCCVRSVQTALAEARDAGLVAWESGARARTSNRYRLLVPVAAPVARVVRRITRMVTRMLPVVARVARRPEVPWEVRVVAQAGLVAIRERRAEERWVARLARP